MPLRPNKASRDRVRLIGALSVGILGTAFGIIGTDLAVVDGGRAKLLVGGQLSPG